MHTRRVSHDYSRCRRCRRVLSACASTRANGSARPRPSCCRNRRRNSRGAIVGKNPRPSVGHGRHRAAAPPHCAIRHYFVGKVGEPSDKYDLSQSFQIHALFRHRRRRRQADMPFPPRRRSGAHTATTTHALSSFHPKKEVSRIRARAHALNVHRGCRRGRLPPTMSLVVSGHVHSHLSPPLSLVRHHSARVGQWRCRVLRVLRRRSDIRAFRSM